MSFYKGLIGLIADVKSTTETVMMSYSLKHSLTINLITAIMNNIITELSNRCGPLSWQRVTVVPSSSRSMNDYWLLGYMKRNDTGAVSRGENVNNLFMYMYM